MTSMLDRMMDVHESIMDELRKPGRDFSVVWWRHRKSKPEVRTDLTWERAQDMREWCNSLRFGIVCVMRTEQLQLVLR